MWKLSRLWVQPGCVFVALIYLFLLPACGASIKTTKVKEYRLAVLHPKPEVKEEFRQLIADFNEFVGQNALKYVDSP